MTAAAKQFEFRRFRMVLDDPRMVFAWFWMGFQCVFSTYLEVIGGKKGSRGISPRNLFRLEN